VDHFYRLVQVDALTGLLAGEDTPPENLKTTLALDLPAQALPWARSQGLVLLPDLVPPGEPEGAGPSLRLVSPGPNVVYYLSPDLPADSQRVHIEAIGQGDLERVSIWVDDQVIATLAQAPYQAWWVLQEGEHRVWAEAVTPEGARLSSQEISFGVKTEQP
jgi:hypothetical protein